MLEAIDENPHHARGVCVHWMHFLLCKIQPILGFCDSLLLPESLHWSYSFPRRPSSSLAGFLFCVDVDVTFAVRRSKCSTDAPVLGWALWVEVGMGEVGGDINRNPEKEEILPVDIWERRGPCWSRDPSPSVQHVALVKLKMWWKWKLPWGYGDSSLHNLAKRKTIGPTHPQTLLKFKLHVFIFKDNTLTVFKTQKNQEGHPFLTSGATSDNGLEIFYICLRAKGGR